MVETATPFVWNSSDEVDVALKALISAEVKRALDHFVSNAYLMLFEDRFTVILDDAGQFQKPFDLDKWLGRFGEDEAEQLAVLKERIEARLAAIGG